MFTSHTFGLFPLPSPCSDRNEKVDPNPGSCPPLCSRRHSVPSLTCLGKNAAWNHACRGGQGKGGRSRAYLYPTRTPFRVSEMWLFVIGKNILSDIRRQPCCSCFGSTPSAQTRPDLALGTHLQCYPVWRGIYTDAFSIKRFVCACARKALSLSLSFLQPLGVPVHGSLTISS